MKVDDHLKAHILEISDDEFESDDELEEEEAETWQDLEQKYNSKEDADVAVFLKITEQLPLSSLLHLLQGHVRSSQNMDIDKYKQQQQQPEEKEESIERPKQQPRQKKFRWADVTDNQVRLVVHEIDPCKGMDELWWDEFELSNIRRQLIHTIKFFMKHHPERIESLEKVVMATESEFMIEKHMKSLSEKSMTRGLEGHMSKVIPMNRKQHVRRILDVQEDCNESDRNYDETCELLREQCLTTAAPLQAFAQRMGRCDEIEALKAEMAPWDDDD